MAAATEDNNFEGYGKIYHSTQAWDLSQQEHDTLFRKTQWVVTEKVHGANLCVILNAHTKSVSFAKRRALLSETESFFHFQSLSDAMEVKMNSVDAMLSQWNYKYDQINVYGEIFGGYYPNVGGSEQDMVQTGIFYSPKVDFYAFDISIVSHTSGTTEFLDYGAIREVFQKCGFLYNEPLFVGSFEDCMSFDIEFDTKIPQKLGYPSLPNNKAEGVVIRPMKELSVNTKKKGKTRPLVKRKIEEFSEEKYNMSVKKAKSTLQVSALQLLEFELPAYVTMNRLNNTISKLGKPDISNKQQNLELMKALSQDSVESLVEDNEEMYAQLPRRDRDRLLEAAEDVSKQIIYEYYKQSRTYGSSSQDN